MSESRYRDRRRSYAWSLANAPTTAPDATTAGTRTTTTIEVSLGGVDPEATHVNIYVDDVLADTVPADTGAVTLTGLTPYNQYSITARASNAGGVGPASDPVTAWTYPTTPTGLSVTARGNTSATISWTASTGGGAASYYWRQDGVGADNGPITSPYEITGLDVDSSFTAEVVAYGNGADKSDYSTSAQINPVAPGAPSSVSVDHPADLYDVDELILDATPPGSGGTPSWYAAYVDGSLTAAATGVLPLSFSGLSANTVYSLELSACNAGGESSKVAVDVNPGDQCTRVGPVSNLAIDTRDNAYVHVTFDMPTNFLNGYSIQAYYDGTPAGGTSGDDGVSEGYYIDNSGAPNTAFTLRLEMLNSAGIACGYAEINIPAYP